MSVSEAAVELLSTMMLRRAGHALSRERQYRIESALAPVMRAHRIATVDALLGTMAADRSGALETEVFEALLNNETYFFRDVAAFDVIGRFLEERLRQDGGRRRLSIWCAGVSTGQEAYSLAMMLEEQTAERPDWRIEILGTDISAAAIARARGGRYNQFEVQRGLSARRLVTNFEQAGTEWLLLPGVKGRVRFHQHDVTRNQPPPGRYDIILCRNLLLYLPPDTRREVFDRLHHAIAPDGALLLGAAETIIGQTDRFEPDPGFRGLYRPRSERAAGRINGLATAQDG